MQHRTSVRNAASNVARVAAGIDWLSMSLDRNAPNSGWWANTAHEVMNEVVGEGHVRKGYKLNGYDGWGAGGCFVGERVDGYFAQFSGSYADDSFWRLYRPDAHLSRLDLRVDVQFKEMPPNVARKGYRDGIRANDKLPLARRRKLYLVMGSDGGDTLYVGSPSSDQRGRLYNKEVQSEDPRYSRTWRYECVYRNDYAGAVAQAVIAAGEADFSAIRTIVSQWYGNRGISTSAFATGETSVVPIVRTLPSDVDKRLAWLRSQVAPALRWLQDAGASTEMWESLGLIKPDDS